MIKIPRSYVRCLAKREISHVLSEQRLTIINRVLDSLSYSEDNEDDQAFNYVSEIVNNYISSMLSRIGVE